MATTPTKAPRGAKKTPTDTQANGSGSTGTFVCPECGREFERAAALGSHRNRAHGIAGSRSSAKAATTARTRGGSARGRSRKAAATATRGASRTRGNATAAAVNRDDLLAALFPNGVPPRASLIREVGQWLDQAERLAKER